ncbi:MAG: hypothetical protein E7572_12865 [Ruminococcaceae bacterium]|nr:hypothetical protein [Oscillospiraceae bacterium]
MCKSFLQAEDVMKLTGVKRTYAYQTIKTMNEQLKAKGAYIFRGRVATEYFCKCTKISPKTIEEQLGA